MANIFPIDFEEKLTMAQDDYILFSDSEDWNKIKKAQYKNLKWEKGDTWPAWKDGTDGKDWTDWESATVTVGSTSTLPSWSSATVTNSWTPSAAVLDFGIPQWPKGEDGKDGTDGKDWVDWKDGADWAAATIAVWSTTTGNPWTSASVVNSWTSSAAVFDFTIPQWATWATGNGIASITSEKVWKITTVTITETNSTVDTFQISDGADGQWSWDVVWPASSTDWDVVIFDWVSGKLIKDGSVALSTLSAWASAWATAVQPWDIGTAAACNTWTSSWNVPILDSNWKLATTILPWVALTDTFTVSTSSDLTSLSSAEQWDLAIVTTENKTYVLSADPYSTAANWKEILAPTGWVTSVNSQTWAVTLDADDISDSTTTNKFVTATDKTTWSGKQDALSTQTAYTSKWTSTKVPTITTNTLWQVTGITETSIAFPVTSVNGSTGAVTVSGFNPWWTATTGYVVTKTAGGYEWQAPSGWHSTITVTLTSAWRSSKSQTVSATGVTVTNDVIVSPAPSSIDDYANWKVYCYSQGSWTLTFKCWTTPSSNLTVNVLIFN